jgi:hypothetical protein
MQHNVVFGQVLVQNSKMMYCTHNVYECTCQLHMILPKGNKLCSPFHIQPPFYNKVWLLMMGECFVLKSKTSWWVPPFHHNVLVSMVYAWMERNLMTPKCLHMHAKGFQYMIHDGEKNGMKKITVTTLTNK